MESNDSERQNQIPHLVNDIKPERSLDINGGSNIRQSEWSAFPNDGQNTLSDIQTETRPKCQC